MTKLDELARSAAKHAYDEMFQDHRGAMKWHGYAAVFGNDGYKQDEKVPIKVELLRQLLAEAGVEEVAFGLLPEDENATDGYSWAMLVRSDDVAALHRMVWRAHDITSTDDPISKALFRKVQGGAAADLPDFFDESHSDEGDDFYDDADEDDDGDDWKAL